MKKGLKKVRKAVKLNLIKLPAEAVNIEGKLKPSLASSRKPRRNQNK